MDKRFNSINKKLIKDAEKTATLGCVTIILTFIIGIFLYPAIEMWLWNKFLIDVFPTIPAITYWQMFGINWLCSLLFKAMHIKGDTK